MSKSNLDNLFQQKANNRSFEFEDEYWNEMELLLEEEEKKERFVFWWWNGKFLLGGLLTVVAVALLYWLLNGSDFSPNISQKESQSESLSKNENFNQNQSSTDFENNSSDENSPNENIQDNSTDNTNTLNNNTRNTTNNNSNRQSPNSITSSRRNNRNRNRQPNDLNNSNNSSNSNNNASDNQQNSSNNSSGQSNPDFPFFDDGTTRGAGVGRKGSRDNVPVGSLSSNASNADADASKNAQSTTLDDKITDALNLLDLIGFGQLDDSTQANLPDIPDRLKPPKEEDEEKEEPTYPITVGAKIGLNRYWHNVDAQNAVPYNLTGGIDFNIPIPLEDNNNLSLGLGVNYWSRGNMNASITEDSTIYSFGFQTVSTTKSVNKSYFLEIPLTLSYRLKKHQITLGASYAHLLTALGSTTTTLSNDFAINTLPTETAFGYKNWLNSYDVAAQFGYKYFWSEKGYIGLQGKYGFRDLTPNAIYANGVFDRNVQLRLLLGYNLFQLGKK